MYDNPCRGKWNLAGSRVEYVHSSCGFYLTGEQGIYPVDPIGMVMDIDLTKEVDD